ALLPNALPWGRGVGSRVELTETSSKGGQRLLARGGAVGRRQQRGLLMASTCPARASATASGVDVGDGDGAGMVCCAASSVSGASRRSRGAGSGRLAGGPSAPRHTSATSTPRGLGLQRRPHAQVAVAAAQQRRVQLAQVQRHGGPRAQRQRPPAHRHRIPALRTATTHVSTATPPQHTHTLAQPHISTDIL
ncbi:LOW QUALITY PROTEIN: Protein of unknown function, partial [Gryllus bimaculatus]